MGFAQTDTLRRLGSEPAVATTVNALLSFGQGTSHGGFLAPQELGEEGWKRSQGRGVLRYGKDETSRTDQTGHFMEAIAMGVVDADGNGQNQAPPYPRHDEGRV